MLPPLDALMAMLGGGGAEPPAEAPLPSLPLGGTMPQPVAMPGQMGPMPDPRPQMDLAKPHHAADLVRELAPLLLQTVAGMRNPRHGAAIGRGQAAGMAAAHRERMADDQQAFNQQKLQEHFVTQVFDDVKGIKDPQQAAQYLSLVEEVGVKQFGMQQGWTTKMPVPKTDQTATLKTEVEKKLAAFDKDPRWKTVAGTPQEGKISFQLSNGQSMSVASARRLTNQQFLDDKGQMAYAPAPSDEAPENKTDYSRFLTRYATKLGKKSANELSADEEIAAKKAYGQADDRPLKGTDPVVEAIRGLTLANLQRNSAAELTPGQATVGGKLADDFRAESKDFIQVSQAYNRVKASAKDPSAAGDLALIFNYMKTLDPGSTVREGEFATAQNAAGIPDRIRAAYNKASSGERLAPAQRADFLDRAKRLYTQALGQHRRVEAQYRERAKAVNVPDKFVITDYGVQDDEAAPTAPATPAASAAPAASAPPKPPGKNVKWSKSMKAWVEVTGTTPDGKPIVRKVE